MKAWVDGGLAPRRASFGHVVPPGADLPQLRDADAARTLVVGRGASVAGIAHAGSVTLLRAVRVAGDVVVGRDLLIGPGCRVAGRIEAGGKVVVQGSQVRAIRAGGDVHLLGNARADDVQAGGDIIVAGAPRTGKLEPGGRVVTRAY